MWEAAREFSISNAYQGQSFPYTGNSARCLLCEQDLDEETVERLRLFEAFCNDKIQQAAAQAAKRLYDAAETFAKLGSLIPDMEKLDADLMEMTPEQRSRLRLITSTCSAFLGHQTELPSSKGLILQSWMPIVSQTPNRIGPIVTVY
jgi:hypothetical protein